MEKKKTIISLLSGVFLVFFIGFLFWHYRFLFLQKVDIAYWKDRFEHSQWQLINSNRPIGDDGLYLYSGYRLSLGDDPSLINAEAPPLGKYLIGLSIRFLDNPYFTNGILYLFTLIIVFLIITKLQIPLFLRYLCIAMVATDPMVWSQITTTMLDLPLLFFFLLFVYSLISFQKSFKSSHLIGYVLTAGISLGFFASTKFPYLSLIPGAVGAYLIYKKLSVKGLFLFGSMFIVGYCIPYIRYFQLHTNFLDFIRYQKWQFFFYRESKLQANFGSAILTLLGNLYQNLSNRTWTHSSEWSIAWPLMIATIVYISLRSSLKKIFGNTLFFLLIPLLYLLLFSFIPFSPRYLLIILPLLYIALICMSKQFKVNHTILLMIIVIILNICCSIPRMYPTPESDINQYIYEWENGLFLDMYDRTTRIEMDRTTFHNTTKQFYSDAEIESVSVALDSNSWHRFSSQDTIPITVTYVSLHLGSWKEKKNLHLIKNGSEWKIVWNWDLLLNGLTDKNTIQTTVDLAKRGSIITNKKVNTVNDEPSYMVFIIPDKIDTPHEEEMLSDIERYFSGKLTKNDIHARYINAYSNSLPVSIGVPTRQLSEIDVHELQKYPSILLKPAYFRNVDLRIKDIVGTLENTAFVERYTTLYSTTNYDGVSGLEKQYNAEVKGTNGGFIKIIDANGNSVKTVIETMKKDGSDVFLKEDY